MAETEDQLSWETLSSAAGAGVPVIYRVFPDPPVDIFVDEGGRRIGLRLLCDQLEEAPLSDLAEVSIHTMSIEGRRYLEVSTEAKELFRAFLAFLLSIGDLVHREQLAPTLAVAKALATWRRLLRSQQLLGDAQVLGLWAELWFLKLIIERSDGTAIRAWTGPLGEPHDFRYGTTEIEVKATLAHRRIHTVSSLQQLIASPDHALFLLSLQLEAGGLNAGRTLPEMIDDVAAFLPPGVETTQFRMALDDLGYSDQHASLYTASYELRTHPRLVTIDRQFPRLVPEVLLAHVPSHERIEEVSYQVNVEGLGWEYPSAEFLSVIGNVK